MLNATVAKIAAARGVSIHSLKKWRQRGEVPKLRRSDFIFDAAKLGITLTEKDFLIPKAKKTKTGKRRSRAAA